MSDKEKKPIETEQSLRGFLARLKMIFELVRKPKT